MERSVLIALTIVLGIVLIFVVWIFASGLISTSAPTMASLKITGYGRSMSATSVVLTVEIRNTGNTPLDIQYVYVNGTGSASVTSATGVGAPPGLSFGVGEPPTPTAGGGITLGGGDSIQLTIRVSGDGLYSGSKLLVYVGYYDPHADKGSVAFGDIPIR